MPSPDTVNAAINKLIAQPNKEKPLIFNSLEANKKYIELTNKLTAVNVSDTNVRVLAAFLQFTSLDIFTDEEIETLAQFDYCRIENTKIVKDLDTQDLNRPYFDLNDRLINVSRPDRINIKSNFQRLLSINKQLTLQYLVSYIINQL